MFSLRLEDRFNSRIWTNKGSTFSLALSSHFRSLVTRGGLDDDEGVGDRGRGVGGEVVAEEGYKDIRLSVSIGLDSSPFNTSLFTSSANIASRSDRKVAIASDTIVLPCNG